MNVCGSCRQGFSSVKGFDRHRVGRHGYTLAEGARRVPPVFDGRRCLAASELEDSGFVLDGRGRWVEVARRADAAARFTVGPGMEQRAA